METDNVEVVETQNIIISMQSRVIDELFKLLSQHIATKELDNLPVLGTINEAAKLRIGLEKRLR